MKPFLPLAAAAVLSAAALAVPAGSALAAGPGHGHHTLHHATKTHGHTTHAQKKLDQQRRGIGHAVAGQVRQVAGMLRLAATSDEISDTDRAGLLTALAADGDAMAAVQASLAAATTHHELVAALHRAVLVRSIARQQFETMIAVATVRDQVSSLATTAGDLQTRVDAATAAGQDSTAVNATLRELTQQLATATTDADDAVAQILAMTPEASHGQLNAALDAAQTELAAAGEALTTAGQDLLAVQQDVAVWSTPTA